MKKNDAKSIQYYLLENRMGEGMYAKVKQNQAHSERDFIELMCMKNPELSPQIIKEVMGTLMDTGLDVMKAGFPLNINNFMRIYPSIKGSFEDINDGFDWSRHSLNFKAVISPVYAKRATDAVRIEKIDRPKGKVEINQVKNERTKENEICKHFTNRVIGRYFIFSGFKLAGIKLRNCRNREEEIFISVESLDISTYTAKELAFTVVYNFELPAWLTDGLDIYFGLVYSGIDEELDDDIESDDYSGLSYRTKWKVL